MFAPLFATVTDLIRAPPPRGDWLEGLAVVAILVAVTGLTYLVTPDTAAPWLPVPAPVAAIFPTLLWVAARCRPVFLAAGILIVGLIIVWATTHEHGPFGNPQGSVDEQIYAGQISRHVTCKKRRGRRNIGRVA